MTKDKMITIHQALSKILKIEWVGEGLSMKELETQVFDMAELVLLRKAQEELRDTSKPHGSVLMQNTIKLITKDEDGQEFLADLCWQLKVEKHQDHVRCWYVKDVYSNEEWHARCYCNLGIIAKRFEAIGHKTKFDRSGYLAIFAKK